MVWKTRASDIFSCIRSYNQFLDKVVGLKNKNLNTAPIQNFGQPIQFDSNFLNFAGPCMPATHLVILIAGLLIKQTSDVAEVV